MSIPILAFLAVHAWAFWSLAIISALILTLQQGIVTLPLGYVARARAAIILLVVFVVVPVVVRLAATALSIAPALAR